MQIIVNGASQEISQGFYLIQLLQQLEIAPDRIAVEINLTVIDRADYDTFSFKEGDRIEIISFIGGGKHAG